MEKKTGYNIGISNIHLCENSSLSTIESCLFKEEGNVQALKAIPPFVQEWAANVFPRSERSLLQFEE